MKVVVDGNIFSSNMNGIPRYAYEILKRLDKTRFDDIVFELVSYNDMRSNIPHFSNIRTVVLPKRKFWHYRVLLPYLKAHNAVYLNFSNYGMKYCNSIYVFHDAIPLEINNDLPMIREIKNKFLFWICLNLAFFFGKNFITVSNEALKSISNWCVLSRGKEISIIGNGWEHIDEIQNDDSVFGEFGNIRKGEYFLVLGNVLPHKNLRWIIDNAILYKDVHYVVVGNIFSHFGIDMVRKLEKCENIIFVGYQSDERVKALMMGAKALVSPSLLEGFGIPPLEALACGTKVIVSDIPVHREIYGDAVAYLDPRNPGLDLNSVDWNKDRGVEVKRVLETYTWENATKKWEHLIRKIRQGL